MDLRNLFNIIFNVLALTLTGLDDFTCGHVGVPLPCSEIRLEDVAEMGYLTSDTEHSDGSKCLGRGEICFRGSNVFKGYYRMPDKTDETIDQDGWCHTGDVSINYNTYLFLIEQSRLVYGLLKENFELLIARKIFSNFLKANTLRQKRLKS